MEDFLPDTEDALPESIVEAYCAANEQQACLMNLALAEAGIRSRVVGGPLHGATGDIPLGWVTSPRIWVPESEFEAARKVIAYWESVWASRPDDEEPWNCPGCGRDVEGNFDICWNCQRQRDA